MPVPDVFLQTRVLIVGDPVDLEVRTCLHFPAHVIRQKNKMLIGLYKHGPSIWLRKNHVRFFVWITPASWEVLLWTRQGNCETTVEGVRVLIGDSFPTAPTSRKGAEATTGEADKIAEADRIAERRSRPLLRVITVRSKHPGPEGAPSCGGMKKGLNGFFCCSLYELVSVVGTTVHTGCMSRGFT